ncbi:MAG: hypothetical protein L0226_00010 [Acidobacteria bacterium]|nr:hypothetical protein [Acidobacteriota bacterium]
MFEDLPKRSLIYLMMQSVYLLLVVNSWCLAQEPVQNFEKLPIGQKDGLKLTAEIHRQHYKADEEMVISVKFENLTEKTLYISKHQPGSEDSFIKCVFGIKDIPALVPFREPRKYTKPQLSLNDFVFIAPRGVLTVNINIRLSDHLFVPGEYRLAIWHESLWSQKEVPQLNWLWGSEHGVLHSEITLNGTPVPEPPRIVITN